MSRLEAQYYIHEKFEFSIGGFASECYYVVLKGNKVIYATSYFFGPLLPGQGTEIVPTQSDWTTFWEKAENLGIWKWKKRYDNSEILDGTQWELKFKINSKSKSIYGSNHYPESFDAFLDAVSELIGGLPVR